MAAKAIKICVDCGPQPRAVFGSNKRRPDGLADCCKQCVNRRAASYRDKHRKKIAAAARAAYQEDPDKFRRRRRQFRKAHPEKQQAYDKRYYKEHTDACRRYTRRRYRKNPQPRRDYANAWRKANPHKRHEYNSRRRAWQKGAITEKVDRRVVYSRDGGKCHICGKSVSLKRMHLDHRIPLSRGGSHTYANCFAAHARCNLRKHNKLPEANYG